MMTHKAQAHARLLGELSIDQIDHWIRLRNTICRCELAIEHAAYACDEDAWELAIRAYADAVEALDRWAAHAAQLSGAAPRRRRPNRKPSAGQSPLGQEPASE